MTIFKASRRRGVTLPALNGSPRNNSRNYYRYYIILIFFIIMSILSINTNTGVRATSPHYAMTFSMTNFNSSFLLADADDLSDPTRSLFHVKNGTHLWYTIMIKSRPAGISLAPANQTGDLVASTFFGTSPLLPPIQTVPFDQQENSYPYEIMRLQASLFGPDQRLQLILSPVDHRAVTLDILNLLLNILGQHAPTASIGLLAPGTLAEILTVVPTMKDFQTLINNYTGALQHAANRNRVQKYAHQCAINLMALLGNVEEQGILADILWKMQGKVISRQSILSTIVQFSTVPFSLPLADSISNTLSALSSTLQNMPSLLLQTTSTIIPTPRPTPMPTPSSTPTSIPTPVPTPIPAPTAPPTPATKITSTTNTTCTMKNTQFTCTKTNTTCTTINTASTTLTTCTTKITPASKSTPTMKVSPPTSPKKLIPSSTHTPAIFHRHKKYGIKHKTRPSIIKRTPTSSPVSTPIPLPTSTPNSSGDNSPKLHIIP